MTEVFLKISLEWRHFYHEQDWVHFSENSTFKLNKFLQFYRTSTMTYGHNFTYISDPQKTFVWLIFIISKCTVKTEQFNQ